MPYLTLDEQTEQIMSGIELIIESRSSIESTVAMVDVLLAVAAYNHYQVNGW